MSHVHQLIYLSAARGEITPSGLEDILKLARRNNEAAGVTGLLLYHDGSFFQVLEGPKDVVDRIFTTIRQDPRHAGVILMQAKDVSDRAFPNWSMGFMNAHALKPEQAAHLIDLKALCASGDGRQLTAAPHVSQQINSFLGSFREFAAA